MMSSSLSAMSTISRYYGWSTNPSHPPIRLLSLTYGPILLISQIAICSWLLDTLLPCFALFAGVPKRQMNLGLGRENFSVIVNHVLFNTDLVHDNYFYAGEHTYVLLHHVSC